jgi:putative flippase GtrA
MVINYKKCLVKNDVKQFIKFIIVGCSNFAVSFSVFYVLYRHWNVSSMYHLSGFSFLSEILLKIGIPSMDAMVANIFGYSAGVLNSFFWNKIWTFQVNQGTVKQFKRFFVLNMVCLVGSTAGIFIFVDILELPYKVVWFVIMSIVTIINFIGSKVWVFHQYRSAMLN